MEKGQVKVKKSTSNQESNSVHQECKSYALLSILSTLHGNGQLISHFKSQLKLKWQRCVLAVNKRNSGKFPCTNCTISDKRRQLETSFKNDVIPG